MFKITTTTTTTIPTTNTTTNPTTNPTTNVCKVDLSKFSNYYYTIDSYTYNTVLMGLINIILYSIALLILNWKNWWFNFNGWYAIAVLLIGYIYLLVTGIASFVGFIFLFNKMKDYNSISSIQITKNRQIINGCYVSTKYNNTSSDYTYIGNKQSITFQAFSCFFLILIYAIFSIIPILLLILFFKINNNIII